MELEQQFEEVEIDRLKVHPGNPRNGDIDLIGESINVNGFFGAIVAQRSTGRILAGNHRWKAAKAEGRDKVPVAWVDVDDDHALRILLADNRTNDVASYNESQLASLLAELNESCGLEGTGYKPEDLDQLLADISPQLVEGNTDPDDIPEDVEPICKKGDIWQLGSHRLMCGDSTSSEDMKLLMNNRKADLLLTDPPYNVDYTGKTEDALKVANDAMLDSDFRAFLFQVFAVAFENMKPGASFYVWHADLEGFNFRGAIRDQGEQVRQCLIWKKQTLVMGRQDYHWQHEPCLYGWKKGASHGWYSDRKQTTVLEFDRPMRSREHPTMKPVALFSYQAGNSTAPQGLVLDSFIGSGTSIIACEKIGRTCYGMELSEKYCDVTIKRWEDFTGRTAVKANADDI